ncbi:hypothetical protein Droror1_Dr00016188 [Drosera rotundifolia]
MDTLSRSSSPSQSHSRNPNTNFKFQHFHLPKSFTFVFPQQYQPRIGPTQTDINTVPKNSLIKSHPISSHFPAIKNNKHKSRGKRIDMGNICGGSSTVEHLVAVRDWHVM